MFHGQLQEHINMQKESLIPTLKSDISTELFSLHQGKSMMTDDDWSIQSKCQQSFSDLKLGIR